MNGMTEIELFIVEKMGAYIAGGMKPDAAAHFTRGELLAIYSGKSWSRDGTGQFIKTPLPEALDIETAIEKADAGLAEILEFCAQRVEKGPPLSTETRKRQESRSIAPDGPPTADRERYNGLEGLKEYVKRKPA